MSIASLNQTGLTSSNLSLGHQSAFSPHGRTSSTRSADSGNFSRTAADQLVRNASFVDSLPIIRASNTTDYARLLPQTHPSTEVPSRPLSSNPSTRSQNINLTTTDVTKDTNPPPSAAEPTNTPVTGPQLLDNPLLFTLLVAALILWNVYGFFIQIKLLFFTETRVSTNQLFDNCSVSTSYFKYMVRLRYSSLIGGYQTSVATIMIDLLDIKDQFVTRFTIPPGMFAENGRSRCRLASGSNVIKLRLNRRDEFPEIGSLRITHDLFLPDGSSIYVQSVQLKDLTHNKLTNVPINRPIKALGPDAKFTEQLYEANKPLQIEADEDMFNDGIAPNVTLTELLMFIFIFTNLSLLSTLLLRCALDFISWPHLIVPICVAANLASLILLVAVIKLYQHFVKERFILKIGSNKWRLIRILFVIVTLNCSLIMTLFSFWLIALMKRKLDLLFLACSGAFIVLSVLVLVLIYSLNHFKINKRLKLKQGSLTALTESQTTREKQTLQTPNLELFVLKTKEPSADKS